MADVRSSCYILLFVCTCVFAHLFEGCGGEMTSAEGSIISPNYPLPYPHDGECFWTITVASGNALRITFDDIQMEGNPQCTYDYVMVRVFSHSLDFPLVVLLSKFSRL